MRTGGNGGRRRCGASAWPAGQRARSLLHDGRARTVLEAILWHDGEARAARERVVKMTPGERANLLRFIDSL